jgi:hypothetical protein
VHHEVEAAVCLFDLRVNVRDLVVISDVQRRHHGLRRERSGQLADVLFETSLVGEDEIGAELRGGLRDSPRQRAMVRDADDESNFPREIGHQRFFLPPRRRRPPPCPWPPPWSLLVWLP